MSLLKPKYYRLPLGVGPILVISKPVWGRSDLPWLYGEVCEEDIFAIMHVHESSFDSGSKVVSSSYKFSASVSTGTTPHICTHLKWIFLVICNRNLAAFECYKMEVFNQKKHKRDKENIHLFLVPHKRKSFLFCFLFWGKKKKKLCENEI